MYNPGIVPRLYIGNCTQAPFPYLMVCGGDRAARSWSRCTQLVPLPSNHQHSVGAVAAGPELYKGWLSGRRRRGGSDGRRRSVTSEALAEALGKGREELDAMGAKGRALVERSYTWEAPAAKLVRAYEEISDQKTKRQTDQESEMQDPAN